MQESKNKTKISINRYSRMYFFEYFCAEFFQNLCTHPKFPTSQTLDDPPNNQNNNNNSNNNGLAYSSTSTTYPPTTNRNRFAVCSSRIVWNVVSQKHERNPTQKKIATDLSKIWTQQQQQQLCDNLVLPCTTGDWNLTHSNWLLLIFFYCVSQKQNNKLLFSSLLPVRTINAIGFIVIIFFFFFWLVCLH